MKMKCRFCPSFSGKKMQSKNTSQHYVHNRHLAHRSMNWGKIKLCPGNIRCQRMRMTCRMTYGSLNAVNETVFGWFVSEIKLRSGQRLQRPSKKFALLFSNSVKLNRRRIV